jgi:mRNA interferase HicA
MKRRDLERKLRIAGCYLKREGCSHSLWINPKYGAIEAIPRHAEIKKQLRVQKA